MNIKNELKIALGIILTIISLPVMGFSLSIWPRKVIVIGLIMLIAGIVFLVLGNRKRPELREFPTDVVINGVHYPKSAFVNVDTFVRGREMVFAIQELRKITGIGPEQAREVVNNWKQYYKS
ncbi:MAG: hypothetical protein K2K19_03055 [Acetatifactor sp.]|nr:hypothetical protein [Acetatifactor sp.]